MRAAARRHSTITSFRGPANSRSAPPSRSPTAATSAAPIRRGSPSYGRWVGAELSAANGAQIWLPAGFAHGFVTLEPGTVVQYKVTAPYSARDERGVSWNDPDIGIAWPVAESDAVLSDRDRALPRLVDLAPVSSLSPNLELAG